jgi:hypothetical protein
MAFDTVMLSVANKPFMLRTILFLSTKSSCVDGFLINISLLACIGWNACIDILALISTDEISNVLMFYVFAYVRVRRMFGPSFQLRVGLFLL